MLSKNDSPRNLLFPHVNLLLSFWLHNWQPCISVWTELLLAPDQFYSNGDNANVHACADIIGRFTIIFRQQVSALLQLEITQVRILGTALRRRNPKRKVLNRFIEAQSVFY